mmetsp:Transcript_28975/g.66466  ORF Transcript_28975/g.66466 Transcript_28975/m.66466 type:complete len:123 (+) Transcript_28975:174-542(+)
MPGQEQHMLLSKHHAVSSTCEPEPKDVGRTIYDDEQICEPGTRLETEDVPGQRSSSIATANGVPISTLEAHHQVRAFAHHLAISPFSTVDQDQRHGSHSSRAATDVLACALKINLPSEEQNT